MKREIPRADEDFADWAQTFLDAAAGAEDKLGLTPKRLDKLRRALAEWRQAWDEHRVHSERAKAASAHKTGSKKSCVREFRKAVVTVQMRAETTDELRDALGLSVPGRKTDEGAIGDLEPPQVDIDHSERGRATVRIRQHDGRRGKPTGTRGAYVYCKLEGEGVTDSSWRNIGGATGGRFVHEIGNKEPVVASYKVAWIWSRGSTMVPVAMSEPVTVAISPLEEDKP